MAQRPLRKGEAGMKCKACRKKIMLDHYVVINQPDPSREKLHLVFRCDCGAYVIPLDLVETGEVKAWVSSGEVLYRKLKANQAWNGEKLSRQAKKVYHAKGEGGYEKWKEEVYFPFVDASVKRMKFTPQRRKVALSRS